MSRRRKPPARAAARREQTEARAAALAPASMDHLEALAARLRDSDNDPDNVTKDRT